MLETYIQLPVHNSTFHIIKLMLLFTYLYNDLLGIDFNSRMIRVDHSICKLEIWDTAGQERFSTITANY